MKKLILIYGSFAGAIMILMLALSSAYMKNTEGQAKFENGEIFGYTFMLLSMSMIFVAAHNYKNKFGGGTISIKDTFKIGFSISLIASICYVIAWAWIVKFYYPNFIDDYSNMVIQKMESNNKPVEEIAKMKTDVEYAKSLYSTWYGFAGITLMEIFPIGLMVTIICTVFHLIKQKFFLNTATS